MARTDVRGYKITCSTVPGAARLKLKNNTYDTTRILHGHGHIGGYDNRKHRNLADVWSTTDGKEWTQFKSPVQFAPRHGVTPYVFDGSLWVVAGNTWPVLNDVWRLTLPEPKGQ